MPSSPHLVTLSLAIGLAALTAGILSHSGLPPEEAYAAAQDAILQGDAGYAVDLLEEAATAGHLGALEQLAESRKQGFLMYQGPQRSPSSTRVAIWSWPGQATRAMNAYERALADSSRTGAPTASR